MEGATSWLVVERKFLPDAFFLPPCSTNCPRRDAFQRKPTDKATMTMRAIEHAPVNTQLENTDVPIDQIEDAKLDGK